MGTPLWTGGQADMTEKLPCHKLERVKMCHWTAGVIQFKALTTLQILSS